jgi:hypothetical protein
MSESAKPGGKLQLFLIAALFLGPLLAAAWLYLDGKSLRPEGRANHGTLLEPIVNLDEALPHSELRELRDGRWLLVYAHTGPCESGCRQGLYTIRQLRLMLGGEMERLGRIFLHGETPPDTVFLANEHEGLVALEDGELSELLALRKPTEVAEGGYYLVDPHGNLILYFAPDLAPRDIVADIERLLRLSRIG